jgi:pyridoxamine 5'-phosphate oxidase
MERYDEALARFREIFEAARASDEVHEPTAMTLATATASGRPSARTVLLKDFGESGFVFYTNTESRKGRQLDENPRAALTFLWAPLGRQVLVEGEVTRVTDAEADAYFASRPRLSQAGAWASQQSRALASKADLEERVAAIEAQYEGQTIPRPPHWTGYRVKPDLIEFWAAGEGRLHDRDRYWFEDGTWQHSLINP